MGNLVFQAASGGQVAVSGPNTASSFTIAVPAVSGTFVTTGDTGTVTTTMLASTTGSGAVVLATSPTLVTPALGTPSSVTLTNATGLPISTGLSGLTTNGVAYATSTSALATGSALTFDGSNLGVGVTPSAWGSNYKALQIGAGNGSISNKANGGTWVNYNAYNNNTNWLYGSTGQPAGLYAIINPAGSINHAWYTAPSGTAGNAISFTQAMTLDNSGTLLLGSTTNTGGGNLLQVSSTNSNAISSTYIWNSQDSGYFVRNLSNTANTAAGITMFGGSSGNSAAAMLMVQETPNSLGALAFFTGGSGRSGTVPEAGRFDSSGNLLVGTTSSSGKVTVNSGASGSVYAASNTGQFQFYGTDGSSSLGLYADATNGNKIYWGGNDVLRFVDVSSERMRIDSSGGLLVNTTTNVGGNKLRVVGTDTNTISNLDGSGTTTATVLLINVGANNTTQQALFVYSSSNSSTNAIIYSNGNIVNRNNSYGAISDVKLKENIVDATPKLADLLKVQVRNYNLKSDPTHKQLGVIAQELEQVFPSMIDESPDKDKDGNDLGTTTKSVKYSVFVPMLIKAVQELSAEIQSLKAEVTTLKGA